MAQSLGRLIPPGQSAFFRYLLLFVFMFVIGSGPARADILTVDAMTGNDPTDWINSLIIPQFDPTTGTLNSIKFTLEGTVDGDVSLENLGGSPATINSTLQAPINATLPVLGILTVSPSSGRSDMLAAFDGTNDFGGTSGVSAQPVTPATLTDMIGPSANAALLALFTGVGNVNIPVEADGMASASAPGGAIFVSQFLTRAKAKLIVDYDFTPAGPVVPEPWTVFLLGSGLLGVGVLRRRMA